MTHKENFQLEYSVTLDTAATVGSNAFLPGSLVDKVTARVPLHRRDRVGVQQSPPYIPATHVKGKARHQCEAILAGLDLATCYAPRGDLMCPHAGLELEGRAFCPACQIFGNPWLAGRVRFSDLNLEELFQGSAERLRQGAISGGFTRVQPGVSLHRSRRVAQQDILFYIERLNEGLPFSGRIEGKLEPSLIALLWVSIREIPALGGSRSRGAGKATTRLERLMLNGQAKPQDELEPFLMEGLESLLELHKGDHHER